MMKNPCSWIPHPAPDTKLGKKHKHKNSIADETPLSESQENSAVPADDHQAILNKAKNK